MTMMRMKMIAKLPLLSTHQCRAPPFRNVACPQFFRPGADPVFGCWLADWQPGV